MMSNTIHPKLENTGKGYNYTVTPEQIEAYKSWTIKEKLQWIWDTNVLLSRIQTPQERKRINIIKHKPTTIEE